MQKLSLNAPNSIYKRSNQPQQCQYVNIFYLLSIQCLRRYRLHVRFLTCRGRLISQRCFFRSVTKRSRCTAATVTWRTTPCSSLSATSECIRSWRVSDRTPPIPGISKDFFSLITNCKHNCYFFYFSFRDERGDEDDCFEESAERNMIFNHNGLQDGLCFDRTICTTPIPIQKIVKYPRKSVCGIHFPT